MALVVVLLVILVAMAASSDPGASAVADGSTAAAQRPVGCVRVPSGCGYPDGSNTGVAPGVVLRASGCVNADVPGQVVENLLIVDCGINVYAPNVTVRNVKIVLTSVDMWALRIADGGSGTISHVEIAGKDKGLGSVQYAILNQTNNRVFVDHANLHHCSDCIQGEPMTVTDSYIHDLANPPGAHIDGFQCNARCQVTLRHNTILNEWPQTSAIALFADFGTPVDSTIDDNLLAGGGYTIYGGIGASSGITVTDNRFSRLYYPQSGSFGLETAVNRSGPGNQWSGNVWDDTNQPIP